MHHFLLSKGSIFLGLLLGLIFSSLSFAEGKKIVSTDNSVCPVILLKNSEYFPAMTAAIDEAKSEIIMSFFLVKAGAHKSSYPDRVLAHLVRAAKRGVKVVLILENSGGRDEKLDAQNRKTKQLLQDKGVEVYFDSPRKTTHTKIIVVDQKLVLLGSHNLTQAALKYNNEISILINQPELAREARAFILKIAKEDK
ncbi:MAG: phospholipase [Deltaproteobacteria bacterium HGW-Deltaproteobacteria-12]|jgi:phosphatidylserine/phosphatidylglycerophosphate/cardiolipin synthase-like enzyme|nr:MAG: phospholipase [Deltaproteobacteria bacterium HGW-Deltaproteobacteria-12]